MTRETKLGVGVAGTFLVLFGTWAGVKHFRGERPEASEPAAQAEATEGAPDSKTSETVATVPAANQPATDVKPAPEPAPLATPIVVAPDMTPPAKPSPTEKTADPEPAPTVMTLPAAVPSATGTVPEPPPPMMPLPTTPTSNPPGGPSAGTGTAPNPTEAPSPALTVPVTPPVTAPEAPPVVEAKKDPGQLPPTNTIIITKPADPPPATPAANPTQPSVTIVPSGISTAATLGAPGSGTAVADVPAKPADRRPILREPRVQSYLEEEYHWQPGDSFAAVSQRYYFTEKYAAALQKYNQDYPLAGPGMKQNPPAISPGQALWVPPVRILERDYPELISDLQPLNDRGKPMSVRPADSTQTPNGVKLCKVRDHGETMYEIARRTLNDSNQWVIVHRNNPTLSRDPRLPIPAGTVLRLPADAKLEAGDVP